MAEPLDTALSLRRANDVLLLAPLPLSAGRPVLAFRRLIAPFAFALPAHADLIPHSHLHGLFYTPLWRTNPSRRRSRIGMFTFLPVLATRNVAGEEFAVMNTSSSLFYDPRAISRGVRREVDDIHGQVDLRRPS